MDEDKYRKMLQKTATRGLEAGMVNKEYRIRKDLHGKEKADKFYKDITGGLKKKWDEEDRNEEWQEEHKKFRGEK